MLSYFLTGLVLGLVPYALVVGRGEIFRRNVQKYYLDILNVQLTKVANSVSEYHNAITEWRDSGIEILTEAARAIDIKAPGHAYAKAVRDQIAKGEAITIKLPEGFKIVEGGKSQ